VPKPLRGLTQFKSYDYKFKLRPNYLLASQTTPGAMNWAVAGGAAGTAPFNAPSVSTTGSATGFANLFDLGLGAAFRLNDISSVSDWQNMYDAYRINKVVCEVEFLQNVASGGATWGSILPTLYMVQDQDSAGFPPNLLTIQGQQGVKRYCVGDRNKVRFTMSIAPRAAPLQAGPATNNYAVGKPGQWLNCASPGINHFGIKYYITDLNMPGTGSVETAIKFQFTYYVSFRGPLNAA